MSHRHVLAVSLGLGLLAGAAAAQPAAAPPLTGYLKADALDGVEILGPPPAPRSPEGRADRQTYLATRALAGSARWDQARKDNDLWKGGALERYQCALGADISPTATPAVDRLLRRIELDGRTIGTPPKDHYNRTRPPIGDKRPLCVAREGWMVSNASYPSGHALVGWAWGLILGELAPAKASALIAAGREIGESRIVCGVHYPSDVAAGRLLGSAMVASEHTNPDFLKDLEAARRELASAPPAMPAHCPKP